MLKAGVFIPGLLRNLKEKPATRDYPFTKVAVADGFRGTPRLRPDTCLGCNACVRDCPSEAIEINLKPQPPEETGNPPEQGKKPVKKYRMTIYLDRCVHCARCADVCPKDAIYLDEDFEVANFSREALCLVSE